MSWAFASMLGRRETEMVDASANLYQKIAALPDNEITKPVKEQAIQQMREEIEVMHRNIMREKWEMLGMHHALRKLLSSELLPAKKRAALEEIDREIQRSLSQFPSVP